VSDFCWLWEPSCRFVIDAGWVQAVASVVAIWYASKIATQQAQEQHQTAMKQVQEQHNLDVRLHLEERKQRRQAIAKTLAERLRHAKGVLNSMLRDLDVAVLEGDRFSMHQEHTYTDILEDLISDFSSISIFDLDDIQLVNDHAVLRSTFKQTRFNYRLLIDTPGTYDQNIRNHIFPTIRMAIDQIDRYQQKLANFEG
jgi:hypothetical protein